MSHKSDYDGAWKEALHAYFDGFLALLWPELHKQVDWSCPPVFMDKELRQITRIAKLGNRRADMLVEVRLLNGKFALALIHVEIQGRLTKVFLLRMYQYHIRIKEKYPEHVLINLAVLTHQARALSSVTYVHEGDWKYSQESIGQLFRIIDAVLRLPEPLEIEFDNIISQIEEEKQMTYVTSIERVRLKRERQKGVAETLTTQITSKFGSLPDWAQARIAQADDVVLKQWAVQILNAQRIDDVFA